MVEKKPKTPSELRSDLDIETDSLDLNQSLTKMFIDVFVDYENNRKGYTRMQ